MFHVEHWYVDTGQSLGLCRGGVFHVEHWGWGEIWGAA